jgi:hypothetical protein
VDRKQFIKNQIKRITSTSDKSIVSECLIKIAEAENLLKDWTPASGLTHEQRKKTAEFITEYIRERRISNPMCRICSEKGLRDFEGYCKNCFKKLFN